MGYSGGYLTAPFTKIAANGQGDLQKALRTTEMTQMRIFANGIINKWSKHKAFINPTIFTQRYYEGGVATARETALRNANFGLSVPALASSPGATLDTQWGYTRPDGRSTAQPQRALDFDLYFADAVQPVQNPEQNRKVHLAHLGTGGTYDMAGANVIINTSGSDYLIGVSDLPGMSDYYLGAVFSNRPISSATPEAGTVLYYKSSTTTIGSGTVSIVLSRSDLETLLHNNIGYYYLCAFTVACEVLTTSPNSGTRYRALPGDNVTSFAGAMSIDRNVLSNAIITRVSAVSPSRISSASDFIDAAPYIGTYFDHDYFPTTAYHLSIGVRITAPSDTDIVIPCSTIKVSVSRSFVDTVGPQDISVYAVKNASFADITSGSISLAKGASTTVYLLLPAMVMSMNRNGVPMTGPSTQMQIEPTFTISSQAGQYDWPTGAMSLGLQNY